MDELNYKEAQLFNVEIISSIIFIGTLVISIIITYNDKMKALHGKGIFNEKKIKNVARINRTIVTIIALLFVYLSFKHKDVAKAQHKNLKPYELQITASELNAIATLIALYIVFTTFGEQYTIVQVTDLPTIG